MKRELNTQLNFLNRASTNVAVYRTFSEIYMLISLQLVIGCKKSLLNTTYWLNHIKISLRLLVFLSFFLSFFLSLYIYIYIYSSYFGMVYICGRTTVYLSIHISVHLILLKYLLSFFLFPKYQNFSFFISQTLQIYLSIRNFFLPALIFSHCFS